MTYKSDCTLTPEILEQIAEQGFDILPELIRTVINMAMQVERQQYLGVQPYETVARATRLRQWLQAEDHGDTSG